MARRDDTRPEFDFYRRAAEVSNTYELVWAGSQWKQSRCGALQGSDELEVYKADDWTTYLVDYHWGRVTLVTR